MKQDKFTYGIMEAWMTAERVKDDPEVGEVYRTHPVIRWEDVAEDDYVDFFRQMLKEIDDNIILKAAFIEAKMETDE